MRSGTRDWLTGSAAPTWREAQHGAEESMLPWLAQTIAAGQSAGAVRTDVPVDLILGVAMGMGQAMDIWLVTQPPDDADLEKAVRTLMDMMRRALEP